ncbi:S8 family serine peptidase [Chitinimonas arctica]|uniref:S8 family serine peptidase n=1 Tax=Chitinimonas arctica TaxID=2594795 RepID=A0A516SLW4_9NEIS|nr:S8 family peptidase [Chitinimonas arctica]QDQ29146.1 S8 family serine peptidase [Chitinimonas arctica]
MIGFSIFKKFGAPIIFSSFALAAYSDPSTPADSSYSGATDEIIVRFKDDRTVAVLTANNKQLTDTPMQIASMRHGRKAKLLYVNEKKVTLWKLDRFIFNTDAETLATAMMKSDPRILYAHPNYRTIFPQSFIPNDSYWPKQWNLQNSLAGINAPAAWDLSTGAGVIVAVVDTGYRPHSDLPSYILPGVDMIRDPVDGRDGQEGWPGSVFQSRDLDATDPGDYVNEGAPGEKESSWHGTHVAGIIGAQANNGYGIAGVAFNSKILPIRGVGPNGGWITDFADGVKWAAGAEVVWNTLNSRRMETVNRNPAKVINMSARMRGACSPYMQEAIDEARRKGAILIAAAGNDHADVSNAMPANCSGVITVGAIDPTGSRAPYSNYGSMVDIVAPGGNVNTNDEFGIVSIHNEGRFRPGPEGFAFMAGTSQAAPHVAGVVASMLSANPNLNADQVKSILKSTAHRFVADCAGCGAGMLDAYSAVMAAKGMYIRPFSATATGTNLDTSRPSLKVTINVGQSDIGKTGDLYIQAVAKNGASYFLTPTGWTASDISASVPYTTVPLGTHEIQVLNGSSLPFSASGLKIYAGYGLNRYDFLTNRFHGLVYALTDVQPTTCSLTVTPNVTALGSSYGYTVTGANLPNNAQAFWFGTKNGIPDANGSLQGSLNVFPITYPYVNLAGQQGKYVRYLQIRNSIGEPVCTTPAVQMELLAAPTCTLTSSPAVVPAGTPYSYAINGTNIPPNAEAYWFGTKNGTPDIWASYFATLGSLPANVAYTSQASWAGTYARYVEIRQGGALICKTNTVTNTLQ